MNNDTNSNLRPVNVFSLILIAIGALFTSVTFFHQNEPVGSSRHWMKEEKRILSPYEVAERTALARMQYEGVNQALTSKKFGHSPSKEGLFAKHYILAGVFLLCGLVLHLGIKRELRLCVDRPSLRLVKGRMTKRLPGRKSKRSAGQSANGLSIAA